MLKPCPFTAYACCLLVVMFVSALHAIVPIERVSKTLDKDTQTLSLGVNAVDEKCFFIHTYEQDWKSSSVTSPFRVWFDGGAIHTDRICDVDGLQCNNIQVRVELVCFNEINVYHLNGVHSGSVSERIVLPQPVDPSISFVLLSQRPVLLFGEVTVDEFFTAQLAPDGASVELRASAGATPGAYAIQVITHPQVRVQHHLTPFFAGQRTVSTILSPFVYVNQSIAIVSTRFDSMNASAVDCFLFTHSLTVTQLIHTRATHCDSALGGGVMSVQVVQFLDGTRVDHWVAEFESGSNEHKFHYDLPDKTNSVPALFSTQPSGGSLTPIIQECSLMGTFAAGAQVKMHRSSQSSSCSRPVMLVHFPFVDAPTAQPSVTPTNQPTKAPSPGPTVSPGSPSRAPTTRPSLAPSLAPTTVPTHTPVLSTEPALSSTLSIDSSSSTQSDVGTSVMEIMSSTQSSVVESEMPTSATNIESTGSANIEEEDDDDSIDPILIIFIALTVILLLVIVCILLLFYIRRRRKQAHSARIRKSEHRSRKSVSRRSKRRTMSPRQSRKSKFVEADGDYVSLPMVSIRGASRSSQSQQGANRIYWNPPLGLSDMTLPTATVTEAEYARAPSRMAADVNVGVTGVYTEVPEASLYTSPVTPAYQELTKVPDGYEVGPLNTLKS